MSALMTEQQSNSNVTEFFSPGPGERLRAARLSMGFDLAKIASELHLTTAVVELLEADDYSDIEARVFVRGYLRNYARIVDMPVESILRQFDEKWPEDDAYQTTLRQSPMLPADSGPGRGWAGAITWLLVIGSLVLFLMWWQGYLDEIVPVETRGENTDEVKPVDAVASSDAGLSADATIDLAQPDGRLLLPALNSSDVAEPVSVVETRAVASELETPTPSVEEPSAIETVVSVAPLESATTPAADTDTAPEDVSVVAPVDDAAPDSSAEDTVIAGVTPTSGEIVTPVTDKAKEIVMTFNAPCWVDVRDSEREFKLFGEMPAGARKVLGGEPPYKLVVGNAGAVTIEIDGEPFDIMPYANGNVARFTLDP